jgi:hypothetical protein
MSRKNSSYGARRVVPDVAQNRFLAKHSELSRDAERKYLNQNMNQLYESYLALANRFGEIFSFAKSSTDISQGLFDEASRVAVEAFHVSTLLSKLGREIVPSAEHFHAFRKDHANESLSALMDKCDTLQYDLKIYGLQFAALHYPIKARLEALFAIWGARTRMLEFQCLMVERREGHEYRSRRMQSPETSPSV